MRTSSRRAGIAALLLGIGLYSGVVGLTAKDGSASAHSCYTPGLETFMVSAETHARKLKRAGAEENWEFARYQLEELEEVLSGATSDDDDLPAPFPALYKSILAPSIEAMEETLKNPDKESFEQGFAKITASCASCHQAVGKSFIRIELD